LICLHHPPVPMHCKWLDSVGLDNGGEFLSRASGTCTRTTTPGTTVFG
jgi:hypothetical protein